MFDIWFVWNEREGAFSRKDISSKRLWTGGAVKCSRSLWVFIFYAKICKHIEDTDIFRKSFCERDFLVPAEKLFSLICIFSEVHCHFCEKTENFSNSGIHEHFPQRNVLFKMINKMHFKLSFFIIVEENRICFFSSQKPSGT